MIIVTWENLKEVKRRRPDLTTKRALRIMERFGTGKQWEEFHAGGLLNRKDLHSVDLSAYETPSMKKMFEVVRHFDGSVTIRNKITGESHDVRWDHTLNRAPVDQDDTAEIMAVFSDGLHAVSGPSLL